MKFFSVAAGLSALALTATAVPTKVVSSNQGSNVKRAAAITETPTTGYATENGGTTGGNGGSTTTVASYAEFTAAVTDDEARIVVVDGAISEGAKVKVGSNKSIIGKDSSAVLEGVALYVKGKKNVIIRNLTLKKVLAEYGDCIGIQDSSNVWIDHVDVSSDQEHGKDYYDGLIDVTHASDYVTISNSYIHDHYKASLVGHSDSNESEDKGHLLVTYANNYLKTLNSRGPSFRFGTGHLFNNYYEDVSDGINARKGAQLLVESNVWSGSKKAVYSVDDEGGVVANDNDFGDSENTAPEGTLTSVPYKYTLLGSGSVKSSVVGTAGATLSF